MVRVKLVDVQNRAVSSAQRPFEVGKWPKTRRVALRDHHDVVARMELKKCIGVMMRNHT